MGDFLLIGFVVESPSQIKKIIEIYYFYFSLAKLIILSNKIYKF